MHESIVLIGYWVGIAQWKVTYTKRYIIMTQVC